MSIHYLHWKRLPLLMLIAFLPICTFCQSKYVKNYKPLADSLFAKYGIPTSVILGIGILESGSGTSRNCRLLNNHFGIVGKNNLLKTHGIRTRYKQYSDDNSSFIDFVKLIARKKFYENLKGNTNHFLWVDAISKSGYSEMPTTWKKLVLSTIKKNKLVANH